MDTYTNYHHLVCGVPQWGHRVCVCVRVNTKGEAILNEWDEPQRNPSHVKINCEIP